MQDEEKNPHHHTIKVKQRINEVIEHMRSDLEKVDDPQFKAMFETAADVLGGLVKVFDDYERKDENAWREMPSQPQDHEASARVPLSL
jgi:hypothetical protein